VNEPGGLGWNATVGDDQIAIHMPYHAWGWNARGCSSLYLGVEFAQPVEAAAISDGQVRAFCWFVEQAMRTFPVLPLNFPTHAQLDGTAVYGARDGKTDVYSRSSPRTTELVNRIMARLGAA
jgi:hypothetical protein